MIAPGQGFWPHLVEVLEGIGQAEPQAVGDLLVGHLEDHPGVPLGEDAGDGRGTSIRHPPRRPKSTGAVVQPEPTPARRSRSRSRRRGHSKGRRCPRRQPVTPSTNRLVETLLSAAVGEGIGFAPFPAKGRQRRCWRGTPQHSQGGAGGKPSLPGHHVLIHAGHEADDGAHPSAAAVVDVHADNHQLFLGGGGSEKKSGGVKDKSGTSGLPCPDPSSHKGHCTHKTGGANPNS